MRFLSSARFLASCTLLQRIHAVWNKKEVEEPQPNTGDKPSRSKKYIIIRSHVQDNLNCWLPHSSRRTNGSSKLYVHCKTYAHNNMRIFYNATIQRNAEFVCIFGLLKCPKSMIYGLCCSFSKLDFVIVLDIYSQEQSITISWWYNYVTPTQFDDVYLNMIFHMIHIISTIRLRSIEFLRTSERGLNNFAQDFFGCLKFSW